MSRKSAGFNRRQFFARSAAVAGAGTLGGGVFNALVARSAYAADPRGQGRVSAYGALRPAGDDLALPPGFQYRVISDEGDMMDDGFPTPKAMDGMAAFPLPNGNVLLIRNHEDNQAGAVFRPRPGGSTSTSAGILNDILETHYGPRAYAYDAFAGGGTTTLEVEPRGQRRLVSQHWSPGGNPAQLRGRTDALGELAHLRGIAREQLVDRIRAESRIHLRGADGHRAGRARAGRRVAAPGAVQP